MLDLHIWGPAFGLPSIDPECVAAVAYLHKSATSSSWRLIPSNNPSISPANLLPALNHDGTWVSGFRQIVKYLTTNGLCADLDEALTPPQKADCIAYSAFISENAAPLLNLSLYVSAANWSATTRPAYSSLLPWPLTWTVPPLIRHEAIKRAEHLGLADLDTDFDPNGGLHLSTGRDALPETFRRHLPAGGQKKTVREEMTPEQATAIRLFAVTEDCLSVLDELLASSEDTSLGLLGTPTSSLDCLALGYLAIMRAAPVPRPFLREWIDHKAQRLVAYVGMMESTCFEATGELPVASPVPNTILGVGARAISTAFLNAPGIGEKYADELRRRAEGGVKGLDRRALVLGVGALVTGAALGYGAMYYRAMGAFGARVQVWKASRGGGRLSQFGDLGSMLNSALGPAPSPAAQQHAGSSTGRLVETDSEAD